MPVSGKLVLKPGTCDELLSTKQFFTISVQDSTMKIYMTAFPFVRLMEMTEWLGLSAFTAHSWNYSVDVIRN